MAKGQMVSGVALECPRGPPEASTPLKEHPHTRPRRISTLSVKHVLI